jgi:DNA-binding CsgD family transcriptional regulator
MDYALAALESEVGAYFLRNDVGLQIAWAIVWAQRPEFAISNGVQKAFTTWTDTRLQAAAVLPPRRRYPGLTDRIREAIQLCVVEGMSADLAADEMGVSPHTIRSYVKEGYRILESYDIGQEYPPEMSAQERAFMRFTALEDEDLLNGNDQIVDSSSG